MNSNVSRPMPRANTGSRFLNWVSDTYDVPPADGTPNRSLDPAGIRRRRFAIQSRAWSRR